MKPLFLASEASAKTVGGILVPRGGGEARLRGGMAAAQVLAADDALITTVLCDQLLRAGSLMNGLEGSEAEALALWHRAAALLPQALTPAIALCRASLLARDESAAPTHFIVWSAQLDVDDQ